VGPSRVYIYLCVWGCVGLGGLSTAEPTVSRADRLGSARLLGSGRFLAEPSGRRERRRQTLRAAGWRSVAATADAADRERSVRSPTLSGR